MRRKALLRRDNVMKNGLRAGSLLLAIGLIGGLAMQPGFAKTFAKTYAKTHHARGAAAEGASTAKRPSAMRATPIEAQPADTGDTAIGVAPSRGGVSSERARSANAPKSAAPGNYQVRRITVPGPSDTVPRNSIGVTVVRPRKPRQQAGRLQASAAAHARPSERDRKPDCYWQAGDDGEHSRPRQNRWSRLDSAVDGTFRSRRRR